MLNSEMSDNKQHSIKVFGMTIQLPSNLYAHSKTDHPSPSIADYKFTDSPPSRICSKQSPNRGELKSSREQTATDSKDDEDEPSSSLGLEESKPEESPSNQTNPNPNPNTNSKKPDQVLPCARCSSMNTKFCYFNNYNVNQPRYFCKNCQRYWTVGGTMRNVPVGAGRRKNKNTQLTSKPPPTFRWDLFPISLYSPPGAWNLQWVASPDQSSSTTTTTTTSSNSTCLGKRGRDGAQNQGVLTPKTSRMDDPSEAAKSSIWETLGVKNDQKGSITINGVSNGGGGFFKGFGDESKGIVGDHERSDEVAIEGSYLALQANPAAFSRSMAFHESAHSGC